MAGERGREDAAPRSCYVAAPHEVTRISRNGPRGEPNSPRELNSIRCVSVGPPSIGPLDAMSDAFPHTLQALLDERDWVRALARRLAGDAHEAEDLA